MSKKTPDQLTARRKALKGLAVGGGVVATQWSKPVVESVIIPAHAAGTTNSGLRSGASVRTTQTIIIEQDIPDP